MNDTITIVTPPDDTNVDGLRIFCFDLSQDQSLMVSQCVTNLETDFSLVIYHFKSFQDYEWFFDKKHKSDIIIFNADSEDSMIVGYLAAQKNSIYFGNLKSLAISNKRTIYDIEGINFYIKKVINEYAT